MSGELSTFTPAMPLPEEPSRPRRPIWPTLAQVAAIVAVFAIVGLGCGWLWHHLAPVAHGIAYDKKWYGLDEKDFRDAFSGTAIYVCIAAVAGAVLGLVAALFVSRDEVATLVAVLAGACLAAFVMARFGMHLGHADPDQVAETAKNGTKIPGDLTLARWTVGAVWPTAALAGLMTIYFLVPRRTRR